MNSLRINLKHSNEVSCTNSHYSKLHRHQNVVVQTEHNAAKKITLDADKIKIAFSTLNIKDAKRSLSLTETIPHPQPNVTRAA